METWQCVKIPRDHSSAFVRKVLNLLLKKKKCYGECYDIQEITSTETVETENHCHIRHPNSYEQFLKSLLPLSEQWMPEGKG